MKIARIDHVSFTVAELERSTRFYELLGFERFKDYVSAGPDAEEGTGTPGAEIEIQWLRHPEGEAMIELLRYRGQPNERAAHNSQVGAAHLCLCVEDLDSEYERLSAEGVPFVSAPHRDEHGVTWVYMRDPDGNVAELVQDPA